MEDDFGDFTMSQRMHTSAAEGLGLKANGLLDLKHGKVINDPIHKHFRLGPVAVAMMDSPQFQRLRDLKQLGLSYYVFPGASHNRFEHCLGVAHLAYEAALHFKLGQPELDITNDDLKVVELAGLCHDLGHGPFSHVFDSTFLRGLGITNWSHEEMSVKILDTIVEDKGLLDHGLSQDQLDRVKAMIMAGSKGAPREARGRQYLHEIVANGRNGLDVDKFDYLMRDAHCCGVPIAAEINRLKTYSKIIGDEICYKWSEYHNVLQIFQTRAALHQRVYGHRKAKAIDHMVVDALRAADAALGISARIWDPREFVVLDDTLLKQIEHCGAGWGAAGEPEACVREAQAVIRRLRNRDLYKYCGEWVIPPEDVRGSWRKPEASDVAGHLPAGSGVTQADIIVMVLAIDLTAGNSNPLDNVSFFLDLDSSEKLPLRGEDMTKLLYKSYEERILRVYSKRSDAASVAAVSAAAKRYMALRFGSRVVCSTPHRAAAQRAPPAGAGLEDSSRKRKLFQEARRA